MEQDADLDPGLIETAHFVAAFGILWTLGAVTNAAIRGVSTVQNVALEVALAMGAPYAYGRRIANEQMGRIDHFLGSIMGGGDRC